MIVGFDHGCRGHRPRSHRHAEIQRYDDPDIETGLQQAGVDPDTASYRLLDVSLDELQDTRWFPLPHGFGSWMVGALQAGEQVPPVVIMATEKGPGFGLIDGLNRTYAHWLLRRPTIRAYELLS